MSAAQIAKRLGSIRRQYEAGNIGWQNYKETLTKIFELAEALADCVAELEAKGDIEHPEA